MKNLAEIEELELFTQIEFIAKQVVEGFITGLHRSPYHGFSVEFAEHRHYNTGESTKHIDWKLYARSEKLFVKKYEEETNLKAHIVIDNSSSMLFPFPEGKLHNKLYFSIYCAAALIRILRSQRDAVGLSIFTDQIDLRTESKLSEVHAQFLYGELSRLLESNSKGNAKTLLNQKTNTSKVLHSLAESLPTRSLVILFTDMFEEGNAEDLFSALQHFRYNKHEVILFHVVDQQLEGKFDYPARPHKFVDMETGEVMKLNPGDLKKQYTRITSDFFHEIKLRCSQYKIDLAEADIRKDFKDVLLPFLIKRSKLY
jgi:uncharacterized protein (DUF58 family)